MAKQVIVDGHYYAHTSIFGEDEYISKEWFPNKVGEIRLIDGILYEFSYSCWPDKYWKKVKCTTF